MRLARSIAAQRLGQWGLALALTAVSTSGLAVNVGNTLQITLGKTNERTGADLKKANFRYGPKQDYDARTNETRIYLPYGNTDGVYYEANNAKLGDPQTDRMNGVNAKDTHGYYTLGFKLHFDKPISAFRLRIGQSEVNLNNNRVAAGFEYSTDGVKWTTIRQFVGPYDKMLDPILDPDKDGKASGLRSQVLYLRCYTRFIGDDKAKPDTGHHWLEVPLCGGLQTQVNEGWWFGHRQWNLWVTAVETAPATKTKPHTGTAPAAKTRPAAETAPPAETASAVKTAPAPDAGGTTAVWAAGDDWPAWRGPRRDGICRETGLLKSWPEKGPELLWKAKGLGEGFSGPAIVGDRLYTMGNIDGKEWVLALDLAHAGKQVWASPIGPIRHEGGGEPGPRATPSIDGTRLYTLGCAGDLVCMDVKDGKILWRYDLVKDFGGKIHDQGYSESPLVDGPWVLCTPGMEKYTMVALDKLTGKLVWATPAGDPAAHASIVKFTAAGVKQYVTFTGERVIGVRAEDGELLWSHRRAAINCMTCVTSGETLFAGNNNGGGLLSIEKTGDAFKAQELYSTKKLKSYHGGLVLVDGALYGGSDKSHSLICLDYKTGDVRWSDKGPGECSVLYADGCLYCRNEDGPINLVEATPSGFHLKGHFDQPDRSKRRAWPHLVIAHGRMYVRDQDLLLCYDVVGKGPMSLAPTLPADKQEKNWVDVTPPTSTNDTVQIVAAIPGRNKVVALSGTPKNGALDYVWSTTSNGETWTRLGIGAGSDPLHVFPLGILLDPADPDTFWLWGNWIKFEKNYGAYKTTDGGTTIHSFCQREFEGLGVDFSDPQRRTMVGGLHESSRAVVRTTDGGKNWVDIGRTLPADSAESQYPLVIDSLTYLIGCSFDKYGPQTLKGTPGIFRTVDGGQHWESVSRKMVFQQPLVVHDAIYWAFYNGTDGGLLKSTDEGATWTEITPSGLAYTAEPILLPNGSIATITASRAIAVSTNGGTLWSSITPVIPLAKPDGLTYNSVGHAFFVWQRNGSVQRFDCTIAAGTASAPSPAGFRPGSGL